MIILVFTMSVIRNSNSEDKNLQKSRKWKIYFSIAMELTSKPEEELHFLKTSRRGELSILFDCWKNVGNEGKVLLLDCKF